MKLLVTGGAGYIGSHTVLELIQGGHEVIVADNLVNSSRESLKRIQKITGKTVELREINVCDSAAMAQIFSEHHIDAVIHFAGLKAVGESTEKPLEYYHNNIVSTLSLLAAMEEAGVAKLIFSSSATVYGDPAELPLTENSQTGVGITNPYGQTKYMIEQILQDVARADDSWQITILRYFNPVGAHPSGLIGEDPGGIPNNLMPFVAQVAVGKRSKLTIHGADYDTPDGTCIRDYIHVIDLAQGHLAALEHIQAGCEVYNLGTGKGTSVFEVIKAFEQACGHTIPYEVGPRRSGDAVVNYASAEKASQQLGWRAEKDIAAACADAWHWQSQNPNGYEEETK